MKKISFIAMLSIVCPKFAMGYDYAVLEASIRNHSYSVEEISQEAYDTAISLNPTAAPVFKLTENGTDVYYKWIAPDLTLYQTLTGQHPFSATEPDGSYLEFLTLDANGNIEPQYYYYADVSPTNNRALNPDNIVNEDFVRNNISSGSGGALYNAGGHTVTSVIGNFINNKANYGGAIHNIGTINTLVGNFISNDGRQSDGAIYNQGSIGSITGDFIDNLSGYGVGGAIYNDYGKSIGSITGNFIKNSAYSDGAAINNRGTIGTIVGDFIGNHSHNGSGAAIYNHTNSTINSIVGDFIDNESHVSSSAILNFGTINALSGNFINNRTESQYNNYAVYNTGTLKLKDSVNFLTQSDNFYNEGNVSTIGGTSESPTQLYFQSVYGSGTLTLNGYTNAVVATGTQFYQNSLTINENSVLYINSDYFNAYNIVNNGTLGFGGQNLNLTSTIQGDGDIVIDGDVISHMYLSHNVAINPGKSLITSIDNIKDATLTNNGTLWFMGESYWANVLDRPLSGYAGNGAIGNKGILYTTPNYIDTDITNDAVIHLTSDGTLTHLISGEGTICIDADITSDAGYLGNLVNTYIGNTTLTLTGGTLSNKIQTTTLVNEGTTITSNADNLAYYDFTNNGDIILTGGTLARGMQGAGNLIINSGTTVNIIPNYSINNNMLNDGTIVFKKDSWYANATLSGTGGISGTGNIVVDGNIVSFMAFTQPTTITEGNTLEIALDNIKNVQLENFGTLVFSSGTLDKALSNYGTSVKAIHLVAAAGLINQDLEMLYNGYLDLNSGTLSSAITGTGSININTDQTVTTNADNLGLTVYANYGALNLTGGTISNNIYASNNVTINNGASVSANADYIKGGLTNNGTLVLTGGLISQNLYGNGNIVIDGDITHNGYQSLSQDVTINSGKSLTINPYRIGTDNLVNNGTLILGTGTLSKSVSGDDGVIVINGDVELGVELTQDITINAGKSLTASLDNMYGINITNNGKLWLEGGTLATAISNYGDVGVISLTASADYIDQDVTNDGNLYLTSGNLAHVISGYGNTTINSGNTVSTIADNIGTGITNNGTVDLTGGTLVKRINGTGDITIGEGISVSTDAANLYSMVTNNGTLILTGTSTSGMGGLYRTITGEGTTIIDGDIISYQALNQDVVINSEKSLTVSLANINGVDLINNGTLWISGGTLEESLSNYGYGGVVGIKNVTTNAAYINQDVENLGNLYLTGGTLAHLVFGAGTLRLNNSNIYVTANADYIDNVVSNKGSLTLTGGTLNNGISGTGRVYIAGDVQALGNIEQEIIINSGSSLHIMGNYISGNPGAFTNNGTLILTGGTLMRSQSGTGSVIIDGDVTSTAVMSLPTTINAGKSLTVSVDRIKNTNLTNNGRLWFDGGTLDKALSNYGAAGNVGTLSAQTGYLDLAFINNGTLQLSTTGSLWSPISGTGTITINSGITISAYAADIDNVVSITSGGRLNLSGGTLNKAINTYGTGSIYINGTVVANASLGANLTVNGGKALTISADNLHYTTNNGTLTLTSGTLSNTISGNGRIMIANDSLVMSSANYLHNPITLGSTATLNLTAGTLGSGLSGTGNVIIAGNVTSNADFSQNNVTINSDGVLTISASKINAAKLTNLGQLIFKYGVLNAPISSYGNYAIDTVSTDAGYIDTDVYNTGTLYLTGGTLLNSVSGYGVMRIDSGNAVTASADLLGNSVVNNGTLTLTGGALTHSVSGSGSISIDDGVSILASASNVVQSVSNNGTLTLTSGSLGGTVSGNGNVVINTGNSVSANASYLQNYVTNNGTLRLTGGTLVNQIMGDDGSIAIVGAVTSNVNMLQPTTINSGSSLTLPVGYVSFDNLTNNGTLWFNGGVLDMALSNYGASGNVGNVGELFVDTGYIDQDMPNNGTLYLSDGTLAHAVTGSGAITLVNGRVLSANADYIGNTVNNNGTLTLTGGTLAKSIAGTGNIIIDGDVIANVNMNQATTINEDSSLRATVSRINSNNLINHGMLWFDGGTLAQGLSNYGQVGHVGNVGAVTASANYIDQDFINNGSLYLSAGTLAHSITGDGDTYINGNVESLVDITQNTTVNSNKALTISADNIATDALTNNGSIVLTGGTLNHMITGSGTTYIDADVTTTVNLVQNAVINSGKSLTASVDNVKDSYFTNNGTLWFSGGTLDRALSTYGAAGNVGQLYANADYLNRNVITNTGTLILTGGTLSKSIVGLGNIVIDGDVTVTTAMAQDTTVNEDNALTVSANNLTMDTLINNGELILTGGALSKFVGGTGTILINAGGPIAANADYIGNPVTNNGVLNLTGGMLSKVVSGTGNIQINNGNAVSANADNIATAVSNAGTLTLVAGTLSKSVSGAGNIVIDGEVTADVNMLQHTTINSQKSLRVSADNIVSNTLVNNGILTLTGGTFANNITGTGDIVIDGNVTANVYVAQDITVNQDKSLTIYANRVLSNMLTNDGSVILNGGILAHNISGTGNIVINNNFSVSANANYLGNAVTNEGWLTLTGGTLSKTISGGGNTVIDGHVISNVNMGQDTIINSGKSLTVSVENIKNTNLTNNGKLWFSGGILDTSISTYADVGNMGNLYANAGFINQEFINNGTLYLTSGTLRNLVTGAGDIVIDGDVVSNVELAQNVSINSGNSLTTAVEKVANTNITNNGMLWFNGGMLNTNISAYGNVGNIGIVNTSANYLDATFENNGILNLMGGVVSHPITGTGNIVISNTVKSSADYLGNSVINNGILFLTDGTLSEYVTGTGNLFIDGDVISNVNMSQDMTINAGKSLTVLADNLHTNTLINNGSLLFTGGVLSNEIRGNGQTVVLADMVNHAPNNNVINITQDTTLTTDGGLLVNTANINNLGTLNITSGNLAQNVNGGNTIITANATTSSKSVADIDMRGVWNIDSNTVHASNATIGGIVNLNIDKLFKDSDNYTGGKLFADSITLGSNAELRLVVAANDLVKGESSGNLKLIESDSWNGDWRNILKGNSLYAMDFNSEDHTIKFTYLKTGEDIVAEQNASQNVYVVVIAWNQESLSDNPAVQSIINQLNYAAQYDNIGYIKILNNIAPTDSNVISGTSTALNTAINNQISDRLVVLGRNGGDTMDGIGIWGQGLYNYSSESGSAGFSGNLLGFSLGADKKFNDNFVLGLGYSLNKTSAKSADRSIDATGHTIFAYGEYRPIKSTTDTEGKEAQRQVSPLHLNATLSYTMTDYTDNAAYNISSEYSTTMLGLNGSVGYNITDAIDLFVGARYLTISQDDYTDNIGQIVSVKDNDILTARFGGKYTGTQNWFAPTAHAELLYDIKSTDRIAVVNTEHSSYQITGDAINPFGLQAGVGFITILDEWNLSLNYDFEWRPDFTSHTGRIRVKYLF